MYLTVYKAVPPIDFKNPSNIQEALKIVAFLDIVISVALTFLLYLFSSFIYLEPWHMFSCLVQYLLLVPSYINILMIYTFCNTHDVSWGTKGDNINTGVLQNKDEQKTIKIEIDYIEDNDIGAKYDKIIHELKNKTNDKQHRNAVIKKDDYYSLKYKYNAKYYLAKYYENGIERVIPKDNSYAFELYSEVSKSISKHKWMPNCR
ncbi:2031_t:CDS:2 [Gigaspora margarita]|uniref:chitin synthase n=1 Tax=Gigaspora margarita TaxID=4874 RepID=A0ABM8VVG6_GIGMA|nr:2031_t:CDS:2 [Gigaspora margarita]